MYNLIKSYEELFEKALKEKGNLEPYLQQLENYDAREIEEFRAALLLSEDIAIKALKTGMMSRKSKEDIKAKIGVFLTPKDVKTHGRAIYAQEAEKCGLNVDIMDLRGNFWRGVYELYYRLNNYVSNNDIVKCIECKTISVITSMRS